MVIFRPAKGVGREGSFLDDNVFIKRIVAVEGGWAAAVCEAGEPPPPNTHTLVAVEGGWAALAGRRSTFVATPRIAALQDSRVHVKCALWVSPACGMPSMRPLC